jgi:hypothetical protein
MQLPTATELIERILYHGAYGLAEALSDTALLAEVRVREMKPLYHIGDLSKLEPSKASERNYEGKGLSVSHYPDSWRKVGKLSGDVWSLHKPDARFHMAYSGRKKATKWAHEQGLIEPTKVYQASYFDDDIGRELAFHYPSRKELEQEHDPDDHPEVEVEVVDTYKLTKKGHARARELGGKGDSLTLASLAYAHHHDYDGVYWHHNHDVLGLSAPAGTIFQHKLSGFKRKKVKEGDWPHTPLNEDKRGELGSLVMTPLTATELIEAKLGDRTA